MKAIDIQSTALVGVLPDTLFVDLPALQSLRLINNPSFGNVMPADLSRAALTELYVFPFPLHSRDLNFLLVF